MITSTAPTFNAYQESPVKSIIIPALLAASISLSSIALAEREGPPRPGRMSMFKEGTSVFNNEISPLYDELNRQCVGDPSHKWLEKLAAIDASIAKLAKPDDKKQLVDYMAVLRPWLEDKVKNVPDVGTWADAKAAVSALIAFSKVAPPPIGETTAELKPMIAYSNKQRALMAKSSTALSYAQTKVFGCEEFLGKPADLFPISATLGKNMQSIEAALTEKARDLGQKVFEPLRGHMETLTTIKTPTTWDEQVSQIRATFAGLALAKDIVANDELYLALGAYESTQYGADQAVLDAKKVVAQFGPAVVKMLDDVSFPSQTKKDALRESVAKEDLKGRKVLHGPLASATKGGREYHENENLRTWVVVLETSWVYAVVKPETWTRPVPDGIAISDLCEIRSFYLSRFTKGPPSYKSKINKWSGPEDFVAPILCKNAKRVSKLK